MSMDLYLWKSPVTGDEEEAKKLIDRHFERQEQGVFEPSADIAAAAEELLRLYPYWPISGEELVAGMSDEERGRYSEDGLAQLRQSGSFTQGKGGPWADLPFDQSDNLLVLSIRWSAHDGVLDDIVRIGREREIRRARRSTCRPTRSTSRPRNPGQRRKTGLASSACAPSCWA